MATKRMGREDPHSGGETHPLMVEKTTQGGGKSHGVCEGKLLLGRESQHNGVISLFDPKINECLDRLVNLLYSTLVVPPVIK